jgi:hypothetical protein
MRPTARIAVCLILFCSSGGLAQQEAPIRGFSAEQASEHRRWEQKLAAIPQPNLREYMEHLVAEPFVLPFEFTNLAETFAGYVRELQELAGKEGGVDLAALAASARQLETRAREFEDRCAKATAAGALSRRRPEELRALNKLLYQSERLLISADGLPGRPWFKHQLYAGLYTGYGVKTVPYVFEGLEKKRWDEARKGVDVVRQRIDALGA